MNQIEEFKTPLHALSHWVKVQGNQVYMTQPLGDGSLLTLTWADVDLHARRIAQYLAGLNLPEKSNIILTGKNTAHWIVVDLAIWMAGHVSVPLYPTLGAEATAYIIEHSDAQLMFVGWLDGESDSWSEVKEIIPRDLPLVSIPGAPEEVVTAMNGTAWDSIASQYNPLTELVQRDPEDLATIVYTSGTTGKPKGVMHCFRSLTAPCRCSKTLWNPSSEDRMLSYLPLAHIAERAAVEIPSLMFGFQVFFNRSLDTFPEDLKRCRPTRFFSVPRLWTKFYQGVNAKIPPAKQKNIFSIPIVSARVKKKILCELGLDQVKVALTGAAPLSEDIILWFRQLGLELLEVFGMTENAAASHATRLGDSKPGYVGVPLPGVECRIDETGEVLVKSPGQMLGYYKNAEETRHNMTRDGFFHTGDRGVQDATGHLKITGRVKELFKTSKGKYVAPVPIENKLGSHPGIEMICATGPGQPQPFALTVLSPTLTMNGNQEHLEAELNDLLDKVNSSLEDHERLNYLVVVKEPWTIESGFLTPTLKLRREMIENRYMPLADQWRELGRKVIWE